MGLFDFLKPSPQATFKRKVIEAMTLKEIDDIFKIYLSEDPKIGYNDEKGRKCTRKLKREEYDNLLFKRIDIIDILDNTPRIKDRFKDVE